MDIKNKSISNFLSIFVLVYTTDTVAQIDYIQKIAKYGLDNDREKLLKSLYNLIDHYKESKKVNMALRLQSTVKDSNQKSGNLTRIGSDYYFDRQNDRETNDLIIDKIRSEYTLKNIIVNEELKTELIQFIKENKSIELLQKFGLPVSNKLLLHGPSGCGKTLASYVVAGELNKPMYVINLGAIVSSKLGETSKNLTKVFKNATQEESIIFIDEFDSLGKIRDYNQDHGEMKRVVNTILQLFDYLPDKAIVIAATNQEKMIDEALIRRFDTNLKFALPNKKQILDLIELTLEKGKFKIPSRSSLDRIIEKCEGLSYYSIQKTLVNAIKRTLFNNIENNKLNTQLEINIWLNLIEIEKKSLNKN